MSDNYALFPREGGGPVLFKKTRQSLQNLARLDPRLRGGTTI
jgi:hypothetical protein